MGLENKPEIPQDVHGKPLYDSTMSPLRCEKLITFIGGTDDAWGDKDGALASAAIFNVTGTVRLRIIGVSETTPVGAGKVEVGVTDFTAVVLAQVQNATTMTAGFIWHDLTLDAKVEASSVFDEIIVAYGADILLTTSVADLTAGAIRFLVSWYPISEGAMVKPSSL